MTEGIVRLFGCIEFTVFFAADFFIAFTLNELKARHPAIDEAAPPDDDAVPELVAGVGAESGSHAYSAASRFAAAMTGTPLSGSRVHTAVIAMSVLAPFLCFLQMVAPDGMAWSMWTVPVWLGYLTIVPGLGLALFYALRAQRVAQLAELDDVTKSMWLSVMWFRLDVVCAMATVMLLGWGSWAVAGCLYAMDVYLAQRLLATERRLVRATRGSQLLPDDYDQRAEMVDHGSTANTRPVAPVRVMSHTA